MLCNNCGANNPDGAKFCGNCGKALSSAVPVAPTAAAPAAAAQPAQSKKTNALAFVISFAATAVVAGVIALVVFHPFSPTPQDAAMPAAPNASTSTQTPAANPAAGASASSSSTASASKPKTWTYEDNYVTVVFPKSWKKAVNGSPVGHTSGVFHTDFTTKVGHVMVFRVDGSEGSPEKYVTSPNVEFIARDAWILCDGHKDPTYDAAGLAEAVKLLSSGEITLEQLGACPDSESAVAMLQAAADKIQISVTIK